MFDPDPWKALWRGLGSLTLFPAPVTLAAYSDAEDLGDDLATTADDLQIALDQVAAELEHHADDRVVGILTSQEEDDLRDEGFVVGYLDADVFELLAANIKTFNDRAERKLGQGLLEDIDYSLVTTQEGVRVRVVAQRAADDDPDDD